MTYNSQKPKWVKDHPEGLIFKMDIKGEQECINGSVWYRPIDPGFEIDHIEIPEVFRGKGYGKNLLSSFIVFCQSLEKENAFEIWLEVSTLNVVALKLYTALGFKQVHFRKQYYADLSDAIVMTLKVNQS